jgi:hypothetical protein
MLDHQSVDLEAGEGEGQTTTTPQMGQSSSTQRLVTNDNAPNESTDSDNVLLTTCERASYQYTCHKKSQASKTRLQTLKHKVTAKFGSTRGLRLTPPMYRKHENIAIEELNGNLFKVLANECMEQLYDDNPNAKFGSIGVLSFARLHHMNLHYFEADLATELADIVEKGDTNRQQMMRVRKKLREYSKDARLLKPFL